ncbi:MAG: leucine-rich repeat domain-containing protein [Candidatus Poribacteria bacterium]|nr:leucine-rich repeat domain-containing protein [Candidatus Poribacteria bacterium]
MTRFTRFHALCVALTLLVNAAAAQVVTIPDSNLDQLVRETLQLPNDVQIERGHMLQLRDLDAGGNRGITNLSGLEYATNLVNLNLYHNPIEDIGPLAKMTNMTGFNLWGCRIVDLRPLRNLKNLSWIVLGNNQISDIGPLSELTNLTSLNLSSNQISDISPFANLANLQHLWIDQNSVEDITILANLTQLTRLRSDTNQIHDISPLANLTRLEELWLNRNAITDITPLTKLKNLQKLYLADNPFHDFSPLFELEGVELDIEISEGFNLVVEIPDPNLRLLIREAQALPEAVPLIQGHMQRLTQLDAGGNRGITDLTGLEYATNLKSLELYHNPIADISPLAQLTILERLNLWGCRIVDLSPLRNLKNLNRIVLGYNEVSDISPLSELTNLTSLDISVNLISDITPLTKLKNLQKLYLADNPFHDFGPLFELEGVELDIEIGEGFNLIVELPDTNLRLLIREALSLPDSVPLTQGQMRRLTRLDGGGDRGITDLTGLEYATNLQSLELYYNPIVDIGPLAHLTKLEGLNLWGCRIVDLSPLRNLKSLRWIVLGGNQISDISPLAELINLTVLHVERNQIVDFSPLANLVNLMELWIHNNTVTDIGPLQGLNLADFRYDEVCGIEPLPPLVRERLVSRGFPSIFQAWEGVIGLDYLTREQRKSLHDLYFSPNFTLEWITDPTTSTHGIATSLAGDLAVARETRQRQLDLNPNMVFLRHIWLQYHSVRPDSQSFPPDSDFWLRDAQGQRVINSYNEYVIKFYEPEVQEALIKRIVDIARCGLYDGVFIDGIGKDGNQFVDRHLFSVTADEITRAVLNIFRTVRSQVREDFLILVNSNRKKPMPFAEYVNGTFMETLTDNHYSDNPGGYTYTGLQEIEDTLIWSEENLRSPQINCLEGWGIPTEPPDSPDNRRWMRVFTTMSLNLSDGFVLYNTGRGGIPIPDARVDEFPWESGHEHIWYPFWDVDLGRPIGPKAQPYEDIPGLFIREFVNGWAVYNRSGKPHVITLPERVQSVRSGLRHTQHAVPDLDGDMFLRITPANPADVNGDGIVNILDLVIVANALGTDKHDVNGDGVTNVLDLVIVAHAIN